MRNCREGRVLGVGLDSWRFWNIERSDSRRFRPWKFDKDGGKAWRRLVEGDEGINCGIRIGKKYLLEDAPRKFSRFTGNANERVLCLVFFLLVG